MEQAVLGVLRTTRDLRQQLCTTTMEQAADLGQVTKAGQELVSTIRNVALANDRYLLQESNEKFREYIEHILEVSLLNLFESEYKYFKFLLNFLNSKIISIFELRKIFVSPGILFFQIFNNLTIHVYRLIGVQNAETRRALGIVASFSKVH